MAKKFDKNTTDKEWKETLCPREYEVLRLKGTEPAHSGQYNKLYDEGVYSCAGCGTQLYKSDTKFNSGCGWPAFYEALPGAVDRNVDNSHGRQRIEITCTKCGGHLGHVFEGEGFPTPTDQRHCVNSASLRFNAMK